MAKTSSHESFTQSFKNEYEHEPDSSFYMRLGIAQLALSGHRNRDARFLNIGSGPDASVRPVLEGVLPYCSEIVLLEPNEDICASYRTADWYTANKDRIRIVCSSVEDVIKDCLDMGKFDVIWCQLVVYYWALEDMPNIIEFIVNILKDKQSIAMFIHSNENTAFVHDIYRKLCPRYRHLEEFKSCLDHGPCKYACFSCLARFPVSDPRKFLELILDHDLYQIPDYFPNGMAEDDRILRDQIITEFICKFTEDGGFALNETFDVYIVNKC